MNGENWVIIYPSPFWEGLWVVGGWRWNTEVPFAAERSADTHSKDVCFCVNLHPLHKETSVMSSESWTNQWVQRHQFRGQLETMSSSPPRSISSPTIGSWQDLQNLTYISSCGATIKSNQNQWVPSRIFMILLHTWAHFATPVIMVAHRVHGSYYLPAFFTCITRYDIRKIYIVCLFKDLFFFFDSFTRI